MSKSVECWVIARRKDGCFLENFTINSGEWGSHFGFNTDFEKAHLFLFKHSAETIRAKIDKAVNMPCMVVRVYVDPDSLQPKDNHEEILIRIWKRIVKRIFH